MLIHDFLLNGKTAPLDVGKELRFSWKLEGEKENTLQQSYQLRLFANDDCLWDSGEVQSQESVGIPVQAKLQPLTAYSAKLVVWSNHGEQAEAELAFETGRWETLRKGQWITGPGGLDDDAVLPTYVFRKQISVSKPVRRARMYASALGCYTVSLGGREVSAEYFAPGYTQYTQRIPYNTYSVTELLRQGDQEIRAEVSGGWYCGRLGLSLKGNSYGPKRALLLELRVEYQDGTEEVFFTDDTWQVTTDGPRRHANFFDGETYDARMENASWNWDPATVYSGVVAAMEAHDGVSVLLHEKLYPLSVRKDINGNYICDFGKNFAGIVGLQNITGRTGQQIRIRHGEVLNADGTLYTANLRTAKAELNYICKDGVQSYLPRFTYMGFRYAEISGLEDVTAETVCAYELYSDMKIIGSFSCSDERINQLQRNILTSQKANFVDIPTDCPQRDERSGWTGDIAMFIPTANFNMDTSLFMRKWLRDVALVQQETGTVTSFVPNNGITKKSGAGAFSLLANTGSAAWGDVATIAPWEMYWSTGDVSYLEEQYDSMVAWVEYEAKMSRRLSFGKGKYIWDKSFQYGDWLAPGESLIDNIKKGKWTATAYFAHSAWIVAQTARILGREEDCKKYSALFEKIRDAFRTVFLDKTGHFKKGFQSIYVLGICFELLSNDEKKLALQDLQEDIKRRNDHLATGFVGTSFLPFALSDNGCLDTAYRLLLQETAPGWLYPISCGATSIWERWDALQEDGTVKDGNGQDMNMVSLNHYAYGAIGNWLYRRMAGLEATEPGYQRFRIAPQPGGGITHAQIRFDSPYGVIESKWEIVEDRFCLNIAVPCNTQAEVILPDGSRRTIGSGKYVLSCDFVNN